MLPLIKGAQKSGSQQEEGGEEGKEGGEEGMEFRG